MSFNIRNGRAQDGENAWAKRKGLAFRAIREGAPDVVGVQETFRSQIDDIRHALPGYGEVGVGRGGGTKGEYSAILYCTDRFSVDESETFWLSDTPEVPSRHWGNACIRVCTWARLLEKRTIKPGEASSSTDGRGGSAFYVYNTHLDHRSQPSREKAVRLIAERIASRSHPDPVVLTGDLNSGEENPAVRYLVGETQGSEGQCPVRFVDSYRVLHPDEKVVGTFHGFTGLSPFGKIDYILVPPEAEVLEAKIVRVSYEGRFPSDHFPVTAHVRLWAAGNSTFPE